MALKIRLARGGAKKRPYYRIVVADSRMPRDGRFIEKIGSYNPMLPKDGERVNLDMEKVKSWIAKGAKPSDRVGRFISQIDAGVWTWEASNNPNKAKPGVKAQERIAEKAEKEAERKAAEEEAKAKAEAESAPAVPATCPPAQASGGPRLS